MYYLTLTINNFDVIVLRELIPGKNGGVLICPDDTQDAQLDNPQYIATIKEIMAHVDTVDLYNDILNQFWYGYPEDESLEKRVQWIERQANGLVDPRKWIASIRRLYNQDWLTLPSDKVKVFGMAILALDNLAQKVEEETRAKAQQSITKGNSRGYVYLLKSTTGHYKIGRSKKPQQRIDTLGVKLPFEIEVECLIAADDMAGLESTLHAKYDHCRINGEWFNLTSDDVQYIKSLAEVR